MTDQHRPVGRQVTTALRTEFGTAVAGVASYDRDTQTIHHRSDSLPTEYTTDDIEDILEHIQLDLLNTSLHEDLHDQTLRATVRMYDQLVTVAAPVTEATGVVVAVHRERTRDIYRDRRDCRAHRR